MSKVQQFCVSKTSVSKIAILVLAIVFAAGLFVVGFDQGHELTHDMRHAAGFPCH